MASDGTAECEHVLPVFKAALYLNLYRTDYKDIMESHGPGDELLYNELKMEYRWAHRCCNQKKKEIEPFKTHYKKISAAEPQLEPVDCFYLFILVSSKLTTVKENIY